MKKRDIFVALDLTMCRILIGFLLKEKFMPEREQFLVLASNLDGVIPTGCAIDGAVDRLINLKPEKAGDLVGLTNVGLYGRNVDELRRINSTIDSRFDYLTREYLSPRDIHTLPASLKSIYIRGKMEQYYPELTNSERLDVLIGLRPQNTAASLTTMMGVGISYGRYFGMLTDNRLGRATGKFYEFF